LIQEQIIDIFSEFLYIDSDEIESDTDILNSYEFSDTDIEDIIDELNNTFEIKIKKALFIEMENIQEITEYIEDLM
jgi:acyl carrier protein